MRHSTSAGPAESAHWGEIPTGPTPLQNYHDHHHPNPDAAGVGQILVGVGVRVGVGVGVSVRLGVGVVSAEHGKIPGVGVTPAPGRLSPPKA